MIGKYRQNDFKPNQQKDSVLFNSMVKQFVIRTVDMVKNNIHEEENVINQILALLQQKMTVFCKTQPQASNKQGKIHNKGSQTIQKIQSAVEQLNKDSDILSQKLFDLSQNLIQNKIIQVEQQKQQIIRSYQGKLLKLKHTFQNEKNVLLSELRIYKQKCYILEECLNEREQYILKQSERLDQNRKQQLMKYLKAIESIYGQIQVIKNFSNQPSANQTQPNQYEYGYGHKLHDNYSEQYYNTRDEEQTQAEYRVRHNQYYNTLDKNRQDIEVQRREAERRYNSKNRYTQVPLPRQNYYIKPQHQRKERSRSTDKLKQERDSNYKVRPIIIQYQQPPQTKSNMKESEIYTRASLKLGSESQQKRVQEKNLRMQGVQQKLHGLKRTLSRQLKNMKK